MHVRVDGPDDGPALLLIHGFTGSGDWFDPLVRRLGGFRIVRVDLLGHGATGGAAADGPEQARAVEAELDALGLERVTAVGHSFGADVACELAEHSPRVERLVIVCQAPDYASARFPPGNRMMTVPVLGPALHGSAAAGGRAASAVVRRVRPRLATTAALAARDFAALDPRMFHVVLVQRRHRLQRRPLDAQVRAAAALGKPTLAIVGRRDGFYGDRYAQRYRDAGAEVVVLPDAGHSPTLDHPDEVAGLIRRFVITAG